MSAAVIRSCRKDMEAVLFFLMLVIISVATDKRVNSAVPGLAIGLTVVFDVLVVVPSLAAR